MIDIKKGDHVWGYDKSGPVEVEVVGVEKDTLEVNILPAINNFGDHTVRFKENFFKTRKEAEDAFIIREIVDS